MGFRAAASDISTAMQQTPFITQQSELEERYLLSSDRVGFSLVAGTFAMYVGLNALLFATIPQCAYFGETERQACFIAFSMQVAAMLIEVCTRERMSNKSSWVLINLFAVKLLSGATNFVLYAFATPLVVDPITGRVNCMLRWAEWTVSAFTMTFVVEAIDATDIRGPLMLATTQGTSTLLGLLLPLCPSWALWCLTCALSFAFYFHMFARLAAKKRALEELREVLPSHSYALRKAQLGLALLRQCTWAWSIFVLNWSVDALARQLISLDSEVDYPFMIDCLVDVIAKMLYSSIIQEKSEAEPILFGQERMQVVDQRMRVVWNDASDVLMVSQHLGKDNFITLASPSIRTMVSDASASQWIEGVVHKRVAYQGALLPSLACETVEELVSRAWRCSSFTCSLRHSGRHERRAIEVSSSTNDQGCVIVIRDITDRLKRHQAEREVICADVARQKDEEANALTRHEVKNGVLAAVTHCDRIRTNHQQAVYDGAIIDPHYDATFLSMLMAMRSGLEQTLETVLSHAMARDVMHGLYVVRTEPTRIVEALQLGGERDERFPVKKTPAELPVVDLDPRLLLHIYRNAISNACKYGKKGGVVATEIVFSDNTLTLRVINEPGDGHQALLALEDSSAVFNKGTRFHSESRPNPTARTSSGDGAWIMQRCAQCMQGRCSISFEEDRTVFEMSCPGVARLDEEYFDSVHVSDAVWAVGVDDCEFQRFILAHIFMSIGVREEQIQVFGSKSDELEGLADILVARTRALPPKAKLLAIIDENLDLHEACQDSVSGSFAVEQARQRLEPAQEARLLALVRSANDSSKDQQLYRQRAHGFLCKERGRQTRTAVLRECARRFGTSTVQQIHVPLHDRAPPTDTGHSQSTGSSHGPATAAT